MKATTQMILHVVIHIHTVRHHIIQVVLLQLSQQLAQVIIVSVILVPVILVPVSLAPEIQVQAIQVPVTQITQTIVLL